MEGEDSNASLHLLRRTVVQEPGWFVVVDRPEGWRLLRQRADGSPDSPARRLARKWKVKKQDRGPAALAGHTPGPWSLKQAWKWGPGSNQDKVNRVPDPGRFDVNGPDGDMPSIVEDVWEPDAKLIAAAPALADAVADLLSAMEMQEKRESGEFHITGEVAFAIWSDAKARATTALRAAGRLATAGSASASENVPTAAAPAASEKEGT